MKIWTVCSQNMCVMKHSFSNRTLKVVEIKNSVPKPPYENRIAQITSNEKHIYVIKYIFSDASFKVDVPVKNLISCYFSIKYLPRKLYLYLFISLKLLSDVWCLFLLKSFVV